MLFFRFRYAPAALIIPVGFLFHMYLIILNWCNFVRGLVWVRGLGETQIERLLLCRKEELLENFQVTMWIKFVWRKVISLFFPPDNFQTHKEQHLIYFETENGAQILHGLSEVLPSFGADLWTDTVSAFLSRTIMVLYILSIFPLQRKCRLRFWVPVLFLCA